MSEPQAVAGTGDHEKLSTPHSPVPGRQEGSCTQPMEASGDPSCLNRTPTIALGWQPSQTQGRHGTYEKANATRAPLTTMKSRIFHRSRK